MTVTAQKTLAGLGIDMSRFFKAVDLSLYCAGIREIGWGLGERYERRHDGSRSLTLKPAPDVSNAIEIKT